MADDQSIQTTAKDQVDQVMVASDEPTNAGQSTESGNSRSSDLAEESALQHLDVSNVNIKTARNRREMV